MFREMPFLDDRFRKKFLWGREPLLAACAARLRNVRDVVWVDLGGGTGVRSNFQDIYPSFTHNAQENVQMMNAFFPIADFKQIYIVDLCHSLCKQAQQKVKKNSWTNVQVIEADACTFATPKDQKATLITFSYSLSSEPRLFSMGSRRNAWFSALF